jgi:hypothetical protein
MPQQNSRPAPEEPTGYALPGACYAAVAGFGAGVAGVSTSYRGCGTKRV